jgi:hypothetical protein
MSADHAATAAVVGDQAGTPSATEDEASEATGRPRRAGGGTWLRALAAWVGLVLVALPSLWWIDQKALPQSIDGGWMMALADATVHGEVSGRDVYATYGWGFQQVGRLARSLHAEASSSDSLILLAALLSVLGGICFVGSLYLLRSVEAVGIPLICAAVSLLGLGQPAWIRSASLLLIAALVARVLGQAESSTNRTSRLVQLAVVGAGGAALQLLTFDLGVFAALTVVGCATSHALFVEGRPLGNRLRSALIQGSAAAAGAASGTLTIVSLLSLGPPAFLDYPRVLLSISSGYARTMGSPWQVAGLWAVALEAMLAFIAIIWVLDFRRFPSQRAELLALALAATVCLRGATTRSDIYHVSLAMVPAATLFFVLGVRAGQGVLRRMAALLVAVALFSSWPTAGLGRLTQAFQAVIQPSVIATRWQEMRSFAASKSLYLPGVLRAGDPTSRLVIFPYANQYGLAAGRHLFTPFVQPYQAGTASLDERYAMAVQAAADVREVLYAMDSIVVGAIDGVPAVTRNPAVFATLWGHFRPVGPEAEGHMLLRRTSEVRTLPSSPVAIRQVANGDLGEVLLEPAECAMLRLHFTVDYPWTVAIGRASPWTLTAFLGQQPVAEARVVALSDQFTTFLSLLPPDQFSHILEGQAPRRRVDRLVLAAVDRSLFAAVPRRVSVEALDCVNP